MPLPTSGTLSLNDIHIEAGGTSQTTASINDADIRGLINKTASTAMSFSEWYGAGDITYVVGGVPIWTNNNVPIGGSYSGSTSISYQAGDMIVVGWQMDGGANYRPNSDISVTINSTATTKVGQFRNGYVAHDGANYLIAPSSGSSVSVNISVVAGTGSTAYGCTAHVYVFRGANSASDYGRVTNNLENGAHDVTLLDGEVLLAWAAGPSSWYGTGNPICSIGSYPSGGIGIQAIGSSLGRDVEMASRYHLNNTGSTSGTIYVNYTQYGVAWGIVLTK